MGWIGEKGLENGSSSITFFRQGESSLGDLGLLGELLTGGIGKGSGLSACLCGDLSELVEVGVHCD